MCLADAGYVPPEGTTCPEDDPVTCGLPPAEHVYAITVRCGEQAE